MKNLLFLMAIFVFICLQSCKPTPTNPPVVTEPNGNQDSLFLKLPEPVLANAEHITLTLKSKTSDMVFYDSVPLPADSAYFNMVELTDVTYSVQIVQLGANPEDTLYNEVFKFVNSVNGFDMVPKIKVAQNLIILDVGEIYAPIVNFFPTSALTDVAALSFNPSVVNVTSTKKLKGVASGTTQVLFTATIDGVATLDTLNVVVGTGVSTGTENISSITFSKTQIALSVGQSKKLEPTLLPSNHSDNLVWNTSSPTIVSVDAEGNVTAIAEGSATITASSSASPQITANIIVNSTSIAPNQVSIFSPSADTVVNINPYSITYLLNGVYTDESVTLIEGANEVSIPQNPTDPAITPAVINIILDQTAPSAPTVSVPSQTPDKRPTFSWVSTSEDDGKGYFRHRLDATKEWVYTEETSFKPEADLADGTYTLTVQERDAAFNWSTDGVGTVKIDISTPKTPKFDEEQTPAYTNNMLPTWVWASGGDNGAYKYRLLPMEGWVDGTSTSFTAVDSLPEGPATLELKEQNASGEWSAVVAYTIHIDTTKPVLELLGNTPDSITLNSTYTDPGALAKDEPKLTDSIKVAGEVDIAKAGAYPLTYSLTDLAGNIATEVARSVVVFEGFLVTVTSQEGATLKKGGGENAVVKGDNLELEVEPLADYEFVSWEVSEGLTISDLTTTSATLSNISADGTVTALVRISAPTIATELTDQGAAVGGSATFVVETNGLELSHKWFVGEDEQSETGSSLTLEGVTAEMKDKVVKVVVSNATGEAQSTATLKVVAPPEITKQPESITKNIDEWHTFTVEATGGDLKYQWKKNGTNVDVNGNENSYTVGPINSGDAAEYSVEVSNIAGTKYSANAVLTVKALPPNAPNISWISPRQNEDGVLDVGWQDNSEDEKGFVIHVSVNEDFSESWEVARAEANEKQKEIKVELEGTFYVGIRAFKDNADPSAWDKRSAKAKWVCEENTLHIAGEDYETININGSCYTKHNLRHETGVSYCSGEDCWNGRLYDLETAKTLCPDTWTLPREDQFVGLKDTWDVSGGKFAPPMVGSRQGDVFDGSGEYAAFWVGDGQKAFRIKNDGYTELTTLLVNGGALSVRCSRTNP